MANLLIRDRKPRIRAVGFAGLLALGATSALWARDRESMFHPDLPKPLQLGIVRDPGDTSTEATRRPLAGLSGVLVSVRPTGRTPPPPAELLSPLEPFVLAPPPLSQLLQDAAEQTLRREGIPVLTGREFAQKHGGSILIITPRLHRDYFRVEVSLRQMVRLERDPRMAVVGATVWSGGQDDTPQTDPATIRKAVDRAMKDFAQDWRMANPQ